MISEDKRHGRRFAVSLNQRSLPGHIVAKNIITSGGIGKPFPGISLCIDVESGRMNNPNSWKGTWNPAGGGRQGIRAPVL